MMMHIPREAKRPVPHTQISLPLAKQPREDRTLLCILTFGAKVFGNIASIQWRGSR